VPDFATLLGTIMGIGIILAAILMGSDPGSFVSIPSLLIVIGGTLSAVMMRYTIKQFFGSLKTVGVAYFHGTPSPTELIEQLVSLAEIGRKSGFVALEQEEIRHPYLRHAVRYVADGMEFESIRRSIMTDVNQSIERHRIGQSVFKRIGDVAPAIGMVGTLIGLVQMLGNMSDPKTIGPAMAVALLTTLYGALIANLIALPIADKLNMRMNEERRNKFIIVDGIEGIVDGANPKMMEEYLHHYLPRALRNDYDDVDA